MKNKRTKFMDDLMNEVINYGGVAAKRCDVYQHALDACLSRLGPKEPDRDKRAKAVADLFAFGPRAEALTPEEASKLIPWDVFLAIY